MSVYVIRSETITISGDLAGVLHYKSPTNRPTPPGPTPAEISVPEVSVTAPWGGVVTAERSTTGGSRCWGAYVTAQDGNTGTLGVGDDGTVLTEPIDYLGDINGTYEFTCDAELCVEVLDDDSNDADGFPDAHANTAQPDPPFGRHVRVFRRTRDGGSVTATITAGGATASSSSTWAAATEIGHTSTVSVRGDVTHYNDTVTCSIAYDSGGDAWPMPGLSYSVSDSEITVSETGTLVTVEVDSTTQVWAVGTMAVAPLQSYDLRGRVWSWDAANGSSLTAYVTRRAGHGHEAVSVSGGTFTDTYSQRRYSCAATFMDRGNPANGIAQAGESLDEWQHLRCFLGTAELTAAGEDATAWRTLLRLAPFDAMSITQAASLTADDGSSLTPGGDYAGTWADVSNTTVTQTGGVVRIACAGGTGAARRTFTSPGPLSGYRYLDLATGGTPYPPTLRIGAKEWTAPTALGGNVYRYDLCSPSNAGVDSDALSTRWPTPTADDSVSGDGCYWGVQQCSAIDFEDLAAGTTYDVDSITLSRASWSRLVVMPSFTRWVAEADASERRRILTGDTDGRQSLEEPDAIRVPDGFGGWTYAERTLAELAADINTAGPRHPGWTAAIAAGIDHDDPAPADDLVWPTDYITRERPACWLHGGGAMYSSGAWTDGSDLATGTVRGQVLADVLGWVPAVGDVWGLTVGADPVGPIIVAAAGILRARAWGLVLDEDAAPAAGVSVEAREVVGGALAGSATSGTLGDYYTGTPYARGGVLHRVSALSGDTPSHDVTPATRTQQRVCLRVAPVGTVEYKALEIDSARSWLHVGSGPRVRTYHLGDWALLQESADYPAVDAWLRLRVDPRRASLAMLGADGASTRRLYVSRDGGISGSEVLTMTATSALVEYDSERGLLIALWENGGAVQRQVSDDGGATWSVAAAVAYGGGTITGTLLDMARDARRACMVLSVLVSGSALVLESRDAGATWALRLS